MASPICVHFYRSEARRMAVLARRYRFMKQDIRCELFAEKAMAALILCQLEIEELAKTETGSTTARGYSAR